jgi:hypothetical protein
MFFLVLHVFGSTVLPAWGMQLVHSIAHVKLYLRPLALASELGLSPSLTVTL